MKYYMGVDTGTYETKGVLLDEAGRIVAVSRAGHELQNPKPNHFEQDAQQDWWEDFCLVTRALLQESGIDPRNVACLGVSALGPDVVAVDETCTPLRKAILYGIDARAEKEIACLNRYYGEERAAALFGRPICSDDAAPKILWIKNNEPDVYKRTYKFLTGTSYLIAKLTDAYVIDQFLAKADFRPLYNDRSEIDELECRLFCRPDQLAACQNVHEIAGCVTARAATQTGLAPGTPVNTGTGDSTAESISCGIVQPGNLVLQIGSSIFMYYCSDRLIRDSRIHGGSFTVPGTYKLSAGTNSAGTLTRWYRDKLFADLLEAEAKGGEAAYGALADLAQTVPPGSEGLITLPYFAGERSPIFDPNSRGVIFGLTLRHTRAHLYRSALEAVGYSIGQILSIIESLELPLARLMAVGGGTQNPAWMQIIADVTGRTIDIPEVTLGACYGDALLAMLSTGALRDFDELSERIKSARQYLPIPENHRVYQAYLAIYTDLYKVTKPLMHQISS